MLAVGFDDMFSAWWFVLMAVLLCLNLTLCSILRFPQLLRQYRTEYNPEKVRNIRSGSGRWEWKPSDGGAKAAVFAGLHFKKPVSGDNTVYAVRNRVGIWGSWICHLGMIVVIIGFGIGQKYMLDTYVYGVPGQEKPVVDTNLKVSIDDFEILLRDDYTVEQYQAELTVTDLSTGRQKSGTAMVNSPFHAFGMDFFQNATGWAATAKVYKNDELIKEELLCQGEFTGLDELPLQVQLTAFYPDYYNDGSGPQTLSPLLKNPVVVYTIYYDGNFFQMDAIGTGLPITIDDYRFVFEDPQQYTLIQIVMDPTMSYVGFGGLVMLIGIFLAFFCRTEELWMREEKDGKTVVFCRSRKGAELFAETVAEVLAAHGQLSEEEEDVTDTGKS